MKNLLIAGIGLLFFLFHPGRSFAYPEGQLYWVVENYPSHFVLYDVSCSDGDQCAENAIDYACQQNSGGSGTYIGVDMNIYAEYFPARKGGWCVKHTSYGNFNANYYIAYLYCNGKKG